MGRIKTKLVKGVTHKLMDAHEEELTKDFKQNKEKVSTMTDISSKKIRNAVAGYITRIKKRNG
ncbi:MAG: 30S ribosomal protein S17e [Nanoarchaeota archaeon]|nr:30S ribosomal protein S17e [Nanoarchaeota archaeon]MBU1270301.1 30S ribosomal protein S17e [Nanoarchaeota archaeon]MBU1604531.1 30S ribosomal protein S17e [Nanoarchaeota archaeon]MBU2442866.1 30S ribosomal protein S17e [Nanoarchaeota archaeon]